MRFSLNIFFVFAMLACNNSYCENTFFVSCENGWLVKCNMDMCSSQIIGNTAGIEMFDIAMTPNRTLYGTNGKNLYKIDTLTANIQFIGNITDTLSVGGYRINSLVALDNDYLVGAGVSDTLHRINVLDGSKIAIGTIGYFPAGDLTWYYGSLLLTGIANELVEINLNQQSTAIESVQLLGIINNPAAAIYGSITIGRDNCFVSSLRIIGFEYYSVFYIDPASVNTSSTCIASLPYSALGATSIDEIANQEGSVNAAAPNVFTPNNDGINDELIIRVEGDILEYDLLVFNRWGTVMYRSSDPTENWDGSYEGNASSPGVYYYVVNLTDPCNKVWDFSGFIELLR